MKSYMCVAYADGHAQTGYFNTDTDVLGAVCTVATLHAATHGGTAVNVVFLLPDGGGDITGQSVFSWSIDKATGQQVCTATDTPAEQAKAEIKASKMLDTVQIYPAAIHKQINTLAVQAVNGTVHDLQAVRAVLVAFGVSFTPFK